MIQINEDYRLDSDKYQFILQKKRINDDENSKNYNKEYWDNEAYLGDIKDVLKYLIKENIKDNMNSIESIIEAIKDLEQIFDKLLEADKKRRLR